MNVCFFFLSRIGLSNPADNGNVSLLAFNKQLLSIAFHLIPFFLHELDRDGIDIVVSLQSTPKMLLNEKYG